MCGGKAGSYAKMRTCFGWVQWIARVRQILLSRMKDTGVCVVTDFKWCLCFYFSSVRKRPFSVSTEGTRLSPVSVGPGLGRTPVSSINRLR